VDEIRHNLEANHFEEAYIQYERDMAGGTEALQLRLPEGKTEDVINTFRTNTPQAQFKVLSAEHVGAIVGKELLNQALWAVAVSLIAIMIYIALRFGELSYGLGALVSVDPRRADDRRPVLSSGRGRTARSRCLSSPRC